MAFSSAADSTETAALSDSWPSFRSQESSLVSEVLGVSELER